MRRVPYLHITYVSQVREREREREIIIIIIIILLLLLGQSVMLIMDNEGNVGLYSIPELTLIHKENCVDASDAV